MNNVIITGNLAREVDLRSTSTGKAVASFAVAVNDGYGENKRTQWIPVVCWQKLAEIASSYLDKGSKVLVKGRLQTRSYEVQDGSKRFVMELIAEDIEFLNQGTQGQTHDGNSGANSFGSEVLPGEDIPF